MRTRDFGVKYGLARLIPIERTQWMFKRMCFIRAFEWCVKCAFDQGFIKMPIYLSTGQESVVSAIAAVFKPYAIFAQHRCHDVYLANGGDPGSLIDELLHRGTGCAGGMGGSASIHFPAIHMIGHDGFIGTQVAVGVGYVIKNHEPTVIFFGDAAAEEGYVLESFGFAASRKLPIFFVCVDNNLSVLTEVSVRRSWKLVDVVKSFGIRCAEEIADDPWTIMHYVDKFGQSLPAFLNIHTVRHWWHNGTGCDGPPEWDRMAIVKEMLIGLGQENNQVHDIECRINLEVEKLWLKHLPKLDVSAWRNER